MLVMANLLTAQLHLLVRSWVAEDVVNPPLLGQNDGKAESVANREQPEPKLKAKVSA